MFKKAKDIAPLHPGMADAMGAQLARQGFKTPEAPAVVEEPITEVEPQEIEEATDGHKGRHADKADGDKKKPVVTDVTPEIGLISTNDKAAKSVLTAIKASAKPTAIKASYSEAKAVKEDCDDCECEPCECDEDDSLSEGTITVKSFTGKAPAGIKMKKIGSSSFGGDDVEMSGPDAKIIAYAKKSLGCDSKCKSIADVQKQVSEMYESKCGSHEEVAEDNTNKKSDDGEGLDKVQPKAVKKKFVNRLDKDIDNDGDTDDSDEYLHRRRKAVAKALED